MDAVGTDATRTTARIGVVTFPGSLDDRDAALAVRSVGAEPVALWHGDDDLAGVDAVILPGGFSYGDYLRAGAIARFSPMVAAIVAATADGVPTLGICNGFQVLCEAGLLPGALTRNVGLHFVCRDQRLRVETTATAWTRNYQTGEEIVIPVKHGDGRFVASPEVLAELAAQDRIVLRYLGGNPNGSADDIAGVCNAERTVMGLMPHPEHAVDELTGSGLDGLRMFTSVLTSLLTHV
ncbi:phosphoribosylformylglycinamidine synthase subunit PurQ [Candidatus Frankia alpina]|uniref:Phosphoribosylformylglycinamidine synthase subunit PurQ n=1 Tax=Candidatus Frankia alpina TaxID=2699483 RepID=A0A4S5ETP6_9ACTN|nr:phosphoribosylformylglycinamidine synthase subunit PurQ [Candidatus Frankia alpina]THJ75907.1 phosphoribosylformylglycinamidine synthase subunit PurQ [Candidatus Frankia alpina]